MVVTDPRTELFAKASERVSELRGLEEEAFKMASEIEQKEMVLEATRHGYRLDITGGNEKEREARLRQALSQDLQYTQLLEKVRNQKAQLGMLRISIGFEERMHKLELASLRGARHD